MTGIDGQIVRLHHKSNKEHTDKIFQLLKNEDVIEFPIDAASFITNLKIEDNNVAELAKVARARWKIENETFNTLKNQGYRLEHNYGHGKKNLAENFANLMFLAFLIDQIQQAVSTIFKTIWKELKTKKKLWSILRTVFVWIEIKSMQEAWIAIAQKYQIRIE
jgi:hypothetical protein